MDPSIEDHWKTINGLHDDIFEAVEPLTDDQINWRHPALSNSIGILLRHVAGSERWWIGEVIGGRPMQRVRDAEFEHERLQKVPLVNGLRDALAVVNDVLEQTTPADLRQVLEGKWRGEPYTYTKEWALLHSLQHTAYHLGQIQLFRKMASSE
ncbi:MAG TPA: DinB family protein [bacterium]|jgi:uncharacterized damage-inducible protein DinB